MARAKRQASKRTASAASEAPVPLPPEHDAGEFATNMLSASRLWQEIMHQLSVGYMKDPIVGIGHTDPFCVTDSFRQVASALFSSPQQVYESQMGLWREHMDLWHHATASLLGKTEAKAEEMYRRRGVLL